MNAGLILSLLCVAAIAGAADMVHESARRVPVAYDVDVVVVGGSTGAIAAACAAAEQGAKVFLAAPELFLGEDMCSTLRLWLEPGETPRSPLARKLFEASTAAGTLPVKYSADLPSAPKHPDTDPPSRLTDGRSGNPQSESVQYDGAVTISADLGKVTEADAACIRVFHRGDFRIGRVDVATSLDGTHWQDAAVLGRGLPEQRDLSAPAIELSTPLKGRTRYVRFRVEPAAGSTRVLVGEIAVRGEARAANGPHCLVTPLHVKRTLDAALLDAGVTFLFGCLPTDVVTDADGRPCGIGMANRAGRQVVLARTIIDATPRAVVARMAGAPFRPFPSGGHTFTRVVIGGEARKGEGVACRRTGLSFSGKGGPHQVLLYTLRLPTRDGSFASFAEADHRARDRTVHPGQVSDSDVLSQVPPDAMHGVASWSGQGEAPLDAFRPKDVPAVFVLGGCADVPRDVAGRLLRPPALMEIGTRIGMAAAKEAADRPKPREPRLRGLSAEGRDAGEVLEPLGGVRPVQKLAAVPQEARGLPVLGTYDVVVIGGGTSGAPAGIGAARRGARTLVVEYQHDLGGVGTLGLIGRYHRGYRGGFTAEVDRAIGAGDRGWNVMRKMAWWRTALREAGADVWFGSLGCGALVDEGRVVGAVVATPHGRGVVLARVVIDATGNADVAAAAGARCDTTDADTVAVQGTGLPVHNLGASYTNTDFAVTDETDMVDVWQLLVYARAHYRQGFDLGRLIDTRERRRVVGEFTLSILDQIAGRTYPDTVAQAISNLDTHGYTIHPYLTLQHPSRVHCWVPYRCLLPKGLDGMLVVGLGLSAHRDATPFVRMQADLQNLGYAAGTAAAMVARQRTSTRSLDIRTLQKHLVKIECLPDDVLSHEDSFPLPRERIVEAVGTVVDGYEGAAVLLAHREQALPLLRDAYGRARKDAERVAYAHVLAVLGDATGIEALVTAVKAAPGLGDGYEYRGMGHDHSRRRMSQVDSLVLALGRTGDRRAVPPILAKLALLGPGKPFSHHSHIAGALERLGDPAAARPLAELLAKPGMSGHAILSVQDAIRLEKPPLGNASRLRSFREIVVARALFRCGDYDGTARRILTRYTSDLRGHFARHAAAVLAAPHANPLR